MAGIEISGIVCHALTCIQVELSPPFVVSSTFLNGRPAKNIFPLIRQKTFLKKTKKGGMARDVTNRGGVRGGIPPGIHTYHRHLQKPERSRFHCSCVCLSRSHVHTSGTKPAICLLGFLVLSLTAIYIFPLIRQKTFLKKTKKGVMACDVTNRGPAIGLIWVSRFFKFVYCFL